MKPLLKKETGSEPKLHYSVRSAHADMNHAVAFTAVFVMHTHIKVLLMNAKSPLYLHEEATPQTAEAAAESTGIFVMQ